VPTVTNGVGVAADDAATWRACASCGALAAYPPELYRCDPCQSEPAMAARRDAIRQLLDRGRR
jgi:hypothetical protein